MSSLFTILFRKKNGESFSARFNNHIESTCKLKYLDLDGNIHDLKYWNRTLNENSTTYHIIHDAIEIDSYADCNSFCCDISKCSQFFKDSSMIELSSHICTDILAEPLSCTKTLSDTADVSHDIKLLNILSSSGDSTMSLINFITLFKDNNSLITDGNSATLISLDSSSDVYSNSSSILSISDSKQYKLETNDPDCDSDSFCCNSISTCTQFFEHSTMSNLSNCCSSFRTSSSDCKTCFSLTGANIPSAKIKQYIGKSISIKNAIILKKDTNLVITDGINAVLISLSKD